MKMFNETEVTKQAEAADNIVLAYCDIDVEINPYCNLSINLSNVCRICGEASSNVIEIFSVRGMELKLEEKISRHLPINMDTEHFLPKKLCMDCYNKLEIANSLVVTSIRTDMRFRRLLNLNKMINYDHRYNEIAKKCSLEISKEICPNKRVEATSVDSVSNKTEIVCRSPQVTETLYTSQQHELHSITESCNEIEGNDVGIEIDDAVIGNQCICCKDMFKTQETFENHKTLCSESDAVEYQQTKSNSNIDVTKFGCLKEINFAFVTRICNVCQECFETEKHFAEHKLAYCKLDQVKNYADCNESSKNKEDCNNSEHSKSNSSSSREISKKCGHCNLIFSTKKELLNHFVKTHESKFLFKCVVCDRSFERWPSLDVHEATHRVDKLFLCDLCGKGFKHSNNLRGHKRIHLDESKKKRHICKICDSAFRSRFHLGEHMNQHNGTKPYSCEKCAKSFYKRIQLRQHKLSHELNKFVCLICGAAFNRKGNMNTHVKRHSRGSGTYTCSICTQKCKSMSELKLHRKTHASQDIINSTRKMCSDKTPCKCQNCDRVFSTQAGLLIHERAHKDEMPRVECNICWKKLANRNSLIYHKKTIHSSERPHLCEFCGESFAFREGRIIHERIHTGERPYTCEICKMKYKCSSHLNQHMKTHSDIKPHKCSYCNKSFTRKSALNVHERIHTGEKPFVCETCNRRFAQKNDMLKHTRTHETKSLRCEPCSEVFKNKKDTLKHIALHGQCDTMIEEYVGIQQQVEHDDVIIQSP